MPLMIDSGSLSAQRPGNMDVESLALLTLYLSALNCLSALCVMVDDSGTWVNWVSVEL